MCHECDSWAHNEYQWDDHDFCSRSCVEAYKERKVKQIQNRVEEIDKEIMRLSNEKIQIMTVLGWHPKKYPWKVDE